MAKNDDDDWGSYVKSFISVPQTPYSSSNIPGLIKLIINSGNEILHHEEDLEVFYSSFVALSTHYISARIGVLSSSLIEVNEACLIIVEFLLARLKQHHENCALSKSHIMELLKLLCKGSNTSLLPKTDVISFTTLLKSAKAPSSCSVPNSEDTTEFDQEAAAAAQKQRLRVSISATTYAQMTAVFNELPGASSPSKAANSVSTSGAALDMTTVVHASGSSGELTGGELCKTFAAMNVATLHRLGGGDALLAVCESELTHLRRYRSCYQEEIAGTGRMETCMPYSHSEAVSARQSLQFVANDVNIVWQVFSLPILEPMTRARLEKIVSITMSCIYASIAATTTMSVMSMSVGSTQLKSGSTSKDEDVDGFAGDIVLKSLEIFNWVSNAIHNSSKAGGHVLQNLHMIGAWCLLRGLQSLLQLSPTGLSDKSKDASAVSLPAKTKLQSDASVGPTVAAAVKTRDPSSLVSKYSYGKIHPGFSTLCVALATKAINLVITIMNDLQVENLSAQSGCLYLIRALAGTQTHDSLLSKQFTTSYRTDANGVPLKEAPVTLYGEYFAIQRVQKIMNCVNMPNLLIFLLGQSFKKGLSLGKTQHHAEVGAVVVDVGSDAHSNSSDSNTFYEEDFSSSDEGSNDDDDSEPILGQWFEETLSPTDAQSVEPAPSSSNPKTNAGASNKQSRRRSSTDSISQVPTDRKEPDSFITLATSIVRFIGEQFLHSTSSPVKACISESTLTDHHMLTLAMLVRDLDREVTFTNSGALYEAFSSAMSYFIHTLIASGTLSDTLQETLLHHLGIGLNPTSTEPWPLQVRPRTLAVLAEVLLLRQQIERDEAATLKTLTLSTAKRASETAIMHIWSRLISALADAALAIDINTCAVDVEDVNVEHLQLVLFLFHSGLTLMQKKSLWMQLCQVIVRVAESLCGRQSAAVAMAPSAGSGNNRLHGIFPMPLTRLLLIADYLLHYFYDMPPSLLKQVQFNLFESFAGNKDDLLDGGKDTANKRYFLCRDIEDLFTKHTAGATKGDAADSLHPRFYNLATADYSTQDTPKVDGLACSFLLSNPDLLVYDTFYESIVTLLAAGSQRDKLLTSEWTLLDASCVRYHFAIGWRLLGSLPPSAGFLRQLELGQPPRLSDGPLLLHTIRWAPRLPHKAFQVWTKDYLVKQGLTTQKAELLMSGAIHSTSGVERDLTLAERCLSDLARFCYVADTKLIVAPGDLPGVSTLYTLDVVLGHIQISLDNQISKSTGSKQEISPPNVDIAGRLLPSVLSLIRSFAVYIRSFVLSQVRSSEDSNLTQQAQMAYNCVAIVSSSVNSKLGLSALLGHLPLSVRGAFEKWNASGTCNEFPAILAWRSAFGADILPAESYIDAVCCAHLAAPSSAHGGFLRHVLNILVAFSIDLSTVWAVGDAAIMSSVGDVLLSLSCDVVADGLHETISAAMEKLIGPADSDEMISRLYASASPACRDIVVEHASHLYEQIVCDALGFLESGLDRASSRVAMEKLFSANEDLLTILLSTNAKGRTSAYGTKVLKFFNKLVQVADRNQEDVSCVAMCTSLSKLAHVESSVLHEWVCRIVVVQQSVGGDTDDSKTSEHRALLLNFISYIVKESSYVGAEVASAILSTLIPLGSQILTSGDMTSFPDLMDVMEILAGTWCGSGHVILFRAVVNWIGLCHLALTASPPSASVDSTVDQSRSVMVLNSKQQVFQSVGCLLEYISSVLTALKHISAVESKASTEVANFNETEMHVVDAVDSDGLEEMAPEDDESTAEDSDDDSLNTKLCTYTVTQKEFMNQHWYHCHTCKMVDGVGVCTVCARVCHRDHDLSYAKYGSFFCDCGAKEDVRCQALTKRSAGTSRESSQAALGTVAFGSEASAKQPVSGVSVCEKQKDVAASLSKHRESLRNSKVNEQLVRQIETCKDVLSSYLSDGKTMQLVISLLKTLMPSIVDNYQQTSALGSLMRAQQALRSLKTLPKVIDTTEQLMTVTSGSQEGAFENVRVNYSGDQGQTIRQLVTSHVLRRISMCALTSPQSRRQHLAISNEKGKVTVLQLSALLKQAHSSKRKLTLTRLTSAPIPFTVLTIAGNPSNEDYLAVCGLKDCHVLTLASSGTVADHLVLHPALETGNYIIKAIWLPGSQTELAIVTADFVKVYDLSADAISPQYYFLLPSGKIRDATFFMSDNERYLLLMSSNGYIYEQVMDSSSGAQHGQFFITNVLDVAHPDVKEAGGQVAGGGISIYYSHALQLLFFSYAQGKSFAAPVQKGSEELGTLFPLTFKSSNGAKSGSSSQPLVQWTEVHGHPGLICALMQTSNTPIVMMVKPDAILVQEIKVQPAKAKVQDMVVIRHAGSASADLRTTLILLCEDGSLRIYMANVEQTSFWMLPSLPVKPFFVNDGATKPDRKKKVPKLGRPANQLAFSVDFFEHCQQSNDVEFGGNDVLQVYNSVQVKHRLNTTGMYIASTKTNGFNIEISNTSAITVMVGLRILVGTQSIERAPSSIELFGRSIPVNLTRHRWYDLPFTREESLTADKKLTVSFGQSNDPMAVTMVDSIKVYTKTKEAFGWPEDSDDSLDSTLAKAPLSTSATPATDGTVENTPNSEVASPVPLTSIDRLLAHALEVLDGCYIAAGVSADEREPIKQAAIELATRLLTLPTPNTVQHLSKNLLSSLFINRSVFHWHKDLAQLQEAAKCLLDYRESHEIDPEAFEHLVYVARSVALYRPVNLVQYAEKYFNNVDNGNRATGISDGGKDEVHAASESAPYLKLTAEEKVDFVAQLSDAFWFLHANRPANSLTAPACMPGLSHIDLIVAALVDVMHAFAQSSRDVLPLLCKIYVRMLLFEDAQVSFSCKQALVRVMRPRVRRRRAALPSPPRSITPGIETRDDKTTSNQLSTVGPQAAYNNSVEQVAASGVANQAPAPASAAANAFEALLAAGGPGGLQALLNMPDADDETMVQLAIALSLQDQSGSGADALNLIGNLQAVAGIEAGQMSDTTVSGPPSDDEAGSLTAVDGQALQPSPVEHSGNGGGSDSGGSQVGSVSGLDGDYEYCRKSHFLRLRMLDRLISYIAELKTVGGSRAIPFLQLVLSLATELDGDSEKDKATLDALLSSLLTGLLQLSGDVSDMAARTPCHEVELVVLRLLSVLMSRGRSSNKSSSEALSFVNTYTGRALVISNGIDYCLRLLKVLLDYWKANAIKEPEGTSVCGQLLKPRGSGSPPDMSPFFLRQYVKSHANNVFEEYPLLLMEIILRLPYQIKKIAEANPSDLHIPAFDSTWFRVLTEYMMTSPQQVNFVRRHVRKLLLYICGSKDKYRQLRDMQFLETHMASVKSICEKRGLDPLAQAAPSSISLTYDLLINLIENLKSCLEIATSRTVNWQKFCHKDEGVIPFLVQVSVSIDDGIAPLILQLLQCALCGSKAVEPSATGGSTSSPAKPKTNKEKKEDKSGAKGSFAVVKKKDSADDLCRYDEALCNSLVQIVCKSVGRDLLVRFIVCFLLDSNQASVRWQAHALVLHIYRSSPSSQREALLELMWSVWPDLPMYGSKAAQFVDLLGYFTIKTSQSSEQKMQLYVEKALALLKTENKTLANHPNGSIYNILQGIVDFDGYYLERDPCLVCNNPEVPFANIKLASIKVDSKFTTTMQIVKLSGSHTISKIVVKITDIKRAKMIRTLVVHYNNRQVQAVVELKNKPGLWHRAKKMVLTASQSEVKIEFPLPIVACNLMIEYSDFYDNIQASVETLQCPRCSASVPANPGVCGNCGENVFQCHKCRAINYDEKDPFLCNACGFCKYAKFDFTLTSRPCCAVDPIENEDDRKKAVSTINLQLDKADHQYKLLQTHKATLDTLLVSLTDHSNDRMDDSSGNAGGSSGSSGAQGTNTQQPASGGSTAAQTSSINKNIQLLAQKYCGDCRSTFEELSKVIQKVLASRKELVEYDRQQQEAAQSATVPLSGGSTPVTPTASPRSSELLPSGANTTPSVSKPRERRSRCYGCTSATVEHCITLLRAMVSNPSLKIFLCGKGLIHELVDYNLRRGSSALRSEVRHLLCLMSNNNVPATEELIELLTQRVSAAVVGHLANPDLAMTVRHEMLLLSNMLQLEDTLWEQRVRCVMRLFILSMDVQSPAILECISLPCLRILHHIIKPAPATSKKNKDKTVESLCGVKTLSADLHVDMHAWLSGNPSATFTLWKKKMPSKAVDGVSVATSSSTTGTSGSKKRSRDKEVAKEAVHSQYLMEKYGMRWRLKTLYSGSLCMTFKLLDTAWLHMALFTSSSVATRQTQCNIIEAMCAVPHRKKELLDVLSGFLDDVGTSCECAFEFLTLYKKLFVKDHWKYYLAVKGVPVKICGLITKEIEELSRLEETSLSSDLSQGYALKSLTDLLATFLEVDNIKHHYKSRMVGAVLNGYLSLRKLVVQRTKMIDDTQEKLLDLLEEMTTGTVSETKEFMAVCVNTVNKYPANDFLSPVFIFERLCSIIFPEANDTSEFFMTLEKDPQQEDFLQGRMVGNPYSSNEPGLGPLMRDVKNKICQDCELVALLEDDTGMELLVCNKIISLDLPVKDVHRKIWAVDHGENEAMRVVYRMRGLLGDATEDMVNTLDSGKGEDIDKEEVYKMANVMSNCGGLRVMLSRLAAIRNLVTGKQLMTVLLKLFDFCLKVKANRSELIKPEMNSISIMLGALNLALLAEQESGTSTKGQTLTEQLLQIMETILLEASVQPHDVHKEFSKLCGDKDQLIVLLDRINSPFVRANNNVLQALMRLIPFLAFGDHEKMLALVNHFKPYLDFNKYDFEHTQDEQVHLDCFCVIAQGIEKNANGRKLKDLIAEHGIVKDAIHYMQMHAPPMMKSDGDSWKEFISKPSLPYALRLLAGLCRDHESTQIVTGDEILPILHSMEQISSDEHVGSLAENLLEALKENVTVAAKIEEVRQQTKAEKKRLAMAMRQKQLGQLGFMTNDRGQVTVKGSVLKQMEDLKEETGLTCCICREGYRYQPTKVLGIYTFTKRVSIDEAEAKPRKAQGYSTVSHFNVIHVDCHLAAVRHARGREEWESAALQNGNTKCNGLLPLWGPQVAESAFASCLARHNTYLQECTGVRDANYTYTVHDLKQLMIKFAMEKSFSEDSGGGGRESNIFIVPYIMHMALYVINTTRSVGREEKNLSNFLKLPADKWIENCFEIESALYWAVMSIHICNHNNWKRTRIQLLKRIIILSHVRNLAPGGTTSLADKAVKEYSVYKPGLMFFGLTNYLMTMLFAKCQDSDANWSNAVADYIRNNDQALQESSRKLLAAFEQELLPCESIYEYCDVMGLLEDVPDPDSLISDALKLVP